MKKTILSLLILALWISFVNAKPVTSTAAKQIAANFLVQKQKAKNFDLTLSYTEPGQHGDAIYYAFNINGDEGFVLVAADDAAHPIIAYSTEKGFVIPAPGTPIAKWMEKRKTEIQYIRENGLAADLETQNEWAGDFNVNASARAANPSSQSVAQLVQTTWNQSPYYNQLCPGGSVTGCTATAMSQIMRFWNYPAHGTGSSSYCDCTSGGYAQNYGTLSANYGATNYHWNNMPLSISNSNNDVDTLMSQCGISVAMDYSPGESSSWVITADNPVCAQNSYITYFGYDPNTIQGLNRSAYADPAWIQLLENDLNLGRPIQYVGYDPNAGGHTWVLDGYDVNNNFHMNWGWGGADNGYYSINNLNPSYNFSQGHEALIGIQPLSAPSIDAGILSVTTPNGNICNTTFTPVVTVKNFGTNILTSCVIKYKIDNSTLHTQNWTGSLATGQTTNVTLASVTTTAGAHTFTSYTTNPNNTTDGNSSNDQTIVNFNVSVSGSVIPVMEGFESSINLPTNWTLYNPDGDVAWQVTSTVAHTGTNCIGFNNCNGDGNNSMAGTKDKFITKTYDFSSTSSSTLSFDVAYVTCTYQSVFYTDSLTVFYSNDCGTSWHQIYYKGGAALATAPDYSGNNCWVPSAAQWRTDNIILPSGVLGHSNVMFAFQNTSGFGQWLYIDNINISSNLTAVNSVNNENGLSVYPNPANGSFTLEGINQTGKVSYSLFDVSGQELKAGEINAVSSSFKETISLNGINTGIYFLKVKDENNTWVRKLIVQ